MKTRYWEKNYRQQKLKQRERDIGVEVLNKISSAVSKQCAKAATTARLELSQITRTSHYRYEYTFTKLYCTKHM
jgi:hypothetical protein